MSKIKGDYERSLEQAREKLLKQSQSELEQQKSEFISIELVHSVCKDNADMQYMIEQLENCKLTLYNYHLWVFS